MNKILCFLGFHSDWLPSVYVYGETEVLGKVQIKIDECGKCAKKLAKIMAYNLP